MQRVVRLYICPIVILSESNNVTVLDSRGQWVMHGTQRGLKSRRFHATDSKNIIMALQISSGLMQGLCV